MLGPSVVRAESSIDEVEAGVAGVYERDKKLSSGVLPDEPASDLLNRWCFGRRVDRCDADLYISGSGKAMGDEAEPKVLRVRLRSLPGTSKLVGGCLVVGVGSQLALSRLCDCCEPSSKGYGEETSAVEEGTYTGDRVRFGIAI